jgi:hypothetical protein
VKLLAAFVLVAALMHGAATLAQSELEKASGAIGKGQSVSTALATVTGTAISPLVGVCAIGIFDYYRTPKEHRGSLPVYEKPKFWIPVGVLLLLIFLKDTVGGFAPLIKKPLDAIEVLLVNKAALVLVGFPILFHEVAKVFGLDSVAQLFALITPRFLPVVYAASAADVGSTARAVGNATLAIVMIAVGIVTMIVVWMVGQAFDVLALLSPFPFLDFLLKTVRNGVFVALAVTTVVSREAGLIFSLAIILVSFLIARWSFRLLVFGVVFSWGLLRLLVFGSSVTPGAGDSVSAFSAGIREIPKRTYGWLRLEGDQTLAFRYRPWLIGATRTVNLGPAATYEVGKGLFFPSIVKPNVRADMYSMVLRLSPVYRGAEEAVRTTLNLRDTRDIRWSKGMKSYWKWLTEESAETPKLAA